MEEDMKDFGLMMFKMVLAQKNGMMEAHIKGIMIWEEKKDMENMNGVIEISIEVIGKIINYADWGYIIMLMEKNMLGNMIII
jgi:hypothetical protein